ncbi:hypothetical protein GWK47_025713 [Chionoecetes opilio]|uniref:Uncharacterized protein n=1 Tax=Chionoecetes opilio TaxID=41210 RepID=A0A8J8WN52_CHIOP|nr:hypothetical protein GWK47_025713 [Chionoecetes opilio]
MPLSLLEAVRTRANRVVDRFVDVPVVKQATGLAENSLDAAEGYLDSLLPRGKGDRRQSLVPGVGVVARASLLGQRTSHRVYRAAVRRMRPDLTYDAQATITLDMMLNYTRTTLLDQLSELARQPEGGEDFGVVMSVVRWPLRIASTAAASLAVTYDTVSVRGVQLADIYLPSVTVSVSRARVSATEAAQRLTVLLQQPGVISRQAAARLTPLLQEAVDLVRERLVSVLPLLQSRVQAVRKQTMELLLLLQKALMVTAGPLMQARTDLLGQRLAELLPAVQATLASLQESALDLAAILGESVTAMLPLLQKTLDTLIGSLMLDGETQEELKEMMAKAAAEARVWRNAVVVVVRMTPGIVLYSSQLFRRLATQIMKDVLFPAPLDTIASPTTSPITSPSRLPPHLVPVKVTMMMPKKDKKNPQEAVKGSPTKHDQKKH